VRQSHVAGAQFLKCLPDDSFCILPEPLKQNTRGNKAAASKQPYEVKYFLKGEGGRYGAKFVDKGSFETVWSICELSVRNIFVGNWKELHSYVGMKHSQMFSEVRNHK